ncbi:MAG: hypothetical protein RMK29_13850 [Myxococcales bacterium]|nr:hypothetical protein [Myxococcota bacterium]MDW8282793.1 hypothetical protein [Myxococcales bacterium]
MALPLRCRGPLLAAGVGLLLLAGARPLAERLIAARLHAWARRLEADLGCPVRLGPCRLRLGPQLGLLVRDVRMGGEDGRTPPLLRLGLARVELAVWPTLRSLGRQVHLSRVALEGLELATARLPSGGMAHQEVLARLRRRPPPSAQERERLARLRIRTVSVQGGALRCQDGPAHMAVESVQAEAEQVQVGAPFPVRLRAAVLGAARPNLELSATVGPLPPDLEVGEPLALVRRVWLHLGPLSLAPLRCLLGPLPAATLEEAELQLELPARTGRLHLEARARGAVTEGPFGLRAELDAALLVGDFRLARLELNLGPAVLRAQADLRRLWTTPQVHVLQIEAEALPLEPMLTLLGVGSAPVRGPAGLWASASGPPDRARFHARLDLPQGLRGGTPEGRLLPLTVELVGTLEPDAVHLERLDLRLGPARATLRGRLIRGVLIVQPDPMEVDLSALAPLVPWPLRPLSALVPAHMRRVGLGGTWSIDFRRGLTLEGVLALRPPGRAQALEMALSGSLFDPQLRPLGEGSSPGEPGLAPPRP